MPKNLFEDDTWIEQKLRDSNPFPASLERDLDERALQDLASILAGDFNEHSVPAESPEEVPNKTAPELPAAGNVVPLKRKSTVTRRWVLGGLAAAAAAVLVAVPLGSSLNGAGKAVASPLALAAIKPTTLGTAEAVEQLIGAAKSHADAADFKPGYLDVEHWEAGTMFVPLDVQFAPIQIADGDLGGTMTITEVESDDRISIPTTTQIRREADGSGTITQTVGEPHSTTGETVHYVPFEGNQKPGSVDTINLSAGQFQGWFPKGPENSAAKLYGQVAKQQVASSAAVADGAWGVVQTIGFMMSDWKFDQTQSVALLETIPKIDGMKVLGTTKDRWGRDAMAFGVDTSAEGGVYKTMLLFSPETGRLTNYVEEFRKDKGPEGTVTYATDVVTRYISVSE
ncbi:hypothetical protein ACFY5D_06650 [Paeniglutamicibacter sp. NPDC012692]|uniref:hypothetical protein n=1 Tax=Paeniglutamicibacter sp. NPDC012692 TaxID=3364388 RepID=UPI0036BAB800